MRLIPLRSAQEGMIVAQTIFGVNGEVLIRKGMQLKANTLKRLKEYYWEYLYIYDELSHDVDVKCTISTETRNEAIQNLKALYKTIKSSKSKKDGEYIFTKSMHEQMQNCLSSVEVILDVILSEHISLVDLFDVKLLDNYKYAHGVNVCLISLVIGKGLGLNSYDLYKLGVGAFFHDLGQMFLPDEVANKQDTFTEEDIKIMRKHPEIGYRYAKDHFNFPTTSYLAILQHHERYDGEGYPHKMKGEDISLFGRIVAIADVFDAITSVKKYRPALTPVGAFKDIVNNSGKQFDPKLVKAFISKVSPYPIGYTLELENGTEAIVLENFEDNPLHPRIRVYKENNVLCKEPYTKIL